MDRELYTDAQLSAILVAILDILAEMNIGYGKDHDGITDSIAKARELVEDDRRRIRYVAAH